MRKLFQLFVLVMVTSFCNGAEPDALPIFAVYPVVGKGDPGAMRFRFKRILTQSHLPDEVTGDFNPVSSVTVGELSLVEAFWTEVGSAPCPALKFSFTRTGYQSLNEVIQKGTAKEYLIVVDSKAVAMIKAAELQKMVVKKVKLIIELQSDSGEKNTELAKRMNAALKK